METPSAAGEAQKQKPSGAAREGHQGWTRGQGPPRHIDKGSQTGTVKAQRRDNQHLLFPSPPPPPHPPPFHR